MKRVRNPKLIKRLCLKLQQVLPTMVNSTTDTTIFPTRMVQVSQFLQFGAHLLSRPPFFRQSQVSRHARAVWDEPRLESLDRGRDLLVHLSLYARDS